MFEDLEEDFKKPTEGDILPDESPTVESETVDLPGDSEDTETPSGDGSAYEDQADSITGVFDVLQTSVFTRVSGGKETDFRLKKYEKDEISKNLAKVLEKFSASETNPVLMLCITLVVVLSNNTVKALELKKEKKAQAQKKPAKTETGKRGPGRPRKNQ